MHFDIISIFPEAFESYFKISILSRAKDEGLINISLHNLRTFTHDKHHKVDDTPYGGGAGMVLKIEPIYECLQFLKSKIKNQKFPTPQSRGLDSSPRAGEQERICTILFSAKGKTFTQADALRLSEYDRLILLCGRYEGVDERVAEHLIDEEISIGEYVLTGGELPAMILIDSVARLLPGVLGNDSSAVDESHSEAGVLEYPQYTKPEEFRGWKVPEMLLSGHHAEIEKWRKEQSKRIPN